MSDRVFVSKLPPSASKMERIMEQVFWEEIALSSGTLRPFTIHTSAALIYFLIWRGK